MTEHELIRALFAKYARSSQQLNQLFECDAELIRIGNQTWGFSMDEFSPQEDFFTADHPEILGANLAVATLSDLYAAGVEPQFFMHALAVPIHAGPEFMDALTNGIKATLEEANCFLCGGDFGMCDTWRYCGFAMGPVGSVVPITRRLAGRVGTLWITGRLGDANRAVLYKTDTPAFELRAREAAFIRHHATGCIDTSSGFMDALWTLGQLNPHMRINLQAESIPLAEELLEYALPQGIPAEAALVGGAGEYELLFGTPRDLPGPARAELEAMNITAIADYCSDAAPGIVIHTKKSIRAMTHPPPCPRATASLAEYVNAVVRFAAAVFGGCT